MNMTRLFLSVLLLVSGLQCLADTLDVNYFRYAGPYVVQTPFVIDTLDVSGKPYKAESVLDTKMSFDVLRSADYVSSVPSAEGLNQHLLGFSLQCTGFVEAELKLEGAGESRVYLDGKKLDGFKMKLEPATHEVVLRLFADGPLDSLKISVGTRKGALALREDGKRNFSLDINTDGVSCGGVSVSAGGKYAAVVHSNIQNGGESSSYTEIVSLADGKVISRTNSRISWMPSSDEYYSVQFNGSRRDIVCIEPLTGVQRTLATDIPEGSFTIPPKGGYLIYSIHQTGPKEGAVHQILTPDDRQPGWRNRSGLARYDIATGVMQPLTFGHNNAWLADISRDGNKILFQTSRDSLTAVRTTLETLYLMDIRTLETKCLLKDDATLAGAQFSPDGKEVLLRGTGESFGGMSCDIREGQTSSPYQYLFFVMNIADGSVKPLTEKGFTPAPQDFQWNAGDGMVYFLAEDKDCMNLFRMNPKNGKASRLPNLEDRVSGFDISNTGSKLVYYGQGLENGDRVYLMDVNKLKQQKLFDFSEVRLADVQMGQGNAYEFTSSRGDVINGFYVLPPDFDPSKKYPMLVHYYGGCSPSARYAIGSYSPQYYAAQGYIFYVINPSGASGFGQEFAARHVNTAGDVVADDIIEGTKQFCKDHPFVDEKHIGCFSASYGGFMTQLLLIKTDIFATGISHAGISSHTSYWGEGYWGYSYSQVSMTGSYPWSRKDLYVDRSPLYNADKIHTPLLFLHGSADTNVPIGESIQMFTALKLLGQDTAFVVVDGENHGIREYGKRRDWLRTISAWFAKYLKEDSSWWDEMYPPKSL